MPAPTKPRVSSKPAHIPKSSSLSQPALIVTKWLTAFRDSLSTASISNDVESLFHSNGWFRDSLIFTWDSRSLHGHAAISSYLSDCWKCKEISNVRLDEQAGLEPAYVPVTASESGIQAAFKFDTPIGNGRGLVTLLPVPTTENGTNGHAGHEADNAMALSGQTDSVSELYGKEWKAFTVYTMLDSLKGHEESGPETGVYGGHTLAWKDVRQDRRKMVEENPHVLVVGGGQCGLMVAARFKQMGIPTLVLEKNDRIGDQWRSRYPTLTLHTTRSQHAMLYQPYPSTWPIYTPRDKVAEWLEIYSVAQDLVIWTRSQLLPTPKYDPLTKRWEVTINRAGTFVNLRPVHVVLATGTLGGPYIPPTPGLDLFTGTILHSSAFPGASGKAFDNKRVVVIGSGNSAADICQDLAMHGTREITMVQRSPTVVASAEMVARFLNHVWPDGVPTELCDFKAEGCPLKVTHQMLEDLTHMWWAEGLDRELLETLRDKGFMVNMRALIPMVTQRLGGYWLDVGCAAMVACGKVKVKAVPGIEVAKLSENTVHFTDGSSLEADVVVFATGYENMRDVLKKTFGEETIEKAGPVWGLDEEGEVRNCYRPSGHPGLWYAPGDFSTARVGSKQLGILIQAIQLGYLDQISV
ncbi:hypothetical protein D9758_002791 [Tetrapyrgos nigripes]|uniref:Flavin-containing monooxygenase n=1 Tax=Tetrapyrgos nigripes TaxID=182062 RepID=A0A8H5LU10_9AGAR|nr:hypothetical protein D9758_002791 [Tetrapyrgos nigripes]